MKTVETIVYEYDELNDEAKERAREWFAEHVADYDWWDFIYEDARNVGLEITGLDLYRHEISGKLVDAPVSVAEKVVKEHGESTETHALAKSFLKEYAKIPETEEDAREDAETDFKDALLEEYRTILAKEYDSMFEQEYLEDGIRANEYTFTETGKRFG